MNFLGYLGRRWEEFCFPKSVSCEDFKLSFQLFCDHLTWQNFSFDMFVCCFLEIGRRGEGDATYLALIVLNCKLFAIWLDRVNSPRLRSKWQLGDVPVLRRSRAGYPFAFSRDLPPKNVLHFGWSRFSTFHCCCAMIFVCLLCCGVSWRGVAFLGRAVLCDCTVPCRAAMTCHEVTCRDVTWRCATYRIVTCRSMPCRGFVCLAILTFCLFVFDIP